MPNRFTAIVDYGLCNIDSITRAVEELGAKAERTRDPQDIQRADRIILPGVGSFGAAMKNLVEWHLADAICERVTNFDVPFLGICLGMQLMATSGEEHGHHAGLGLIPGTVVQLQRQTSEDRIPHMGWNEVHLKRNSPLFESIAPGSDFYFVHSYHFQATDAQSEICHTPYCDGLTSAIQLSDRPIYGTQFHPEKSQRPGRQLLRNFLEA
ncbi:imidazole glycerol phosphate synthase subunit HisH [Tardiphaga alba]|uniref:Imidazole glycerol phosphate synthase subunit HisH n=1 Tax=Tardiphaga alba TaxID=340268 RepID=A0ABX8A8W8_9BRAD|nr:imidazole glycerol phosphate synthase subunit HisH [Tardiphaga alba]QUS39109.1 imidazole glycerol phosphate synthase subunit HisH [Tardiphaga alba]